MDLEKKERRSSLKCSDSAAVKRFGGHVDHAKPKRRISFCGRKSVREFHAEEKPKSWNNSYEISDHLNVSGNTTLGCKTATSTDYKENGVNEESILTVSKNSHYMENQSKVVLRENNMEIHNLAYKVFNITGKGFLHHGDQNEVDGCEIKPISTEDTYYGNEDILTDGKMVSKANQKRFSVMQAMEMDISKVHENEAHSTNKLINVSNNDEIEFITNKFNNQLTTITFESIESVNNAGRRSMNFEESMDISMQMNEHMDINSKNNYSHLNSKGELQITATTEPIATKACASSENLFTGTILKIKDNRFLCANTIVESGSDGQYSNNSSICNIEGKSDIKNDENSSLRSVSYNSPLFPPIKSKKLNLRQLNAEICDGKIVVFPNKFKQQTSPNINNVLKMHFKDEEYINDISEVINNKKDVSEFLEYEDMTTDNTSFLVREKVGDETVFGNVSKQAEHDGGNTFPTKEVFSSSIIKDISLESINRDFPNNVQNISGLKPSTYILNAKKSNASNKDFRRSVYDPLDMSLNLTNIQTLRNTSPKRRESEDTETCYETKDVTELDLTPQNNKNLYKQRHTICFNEDIAPLKSDLHSLSGLDSNKLESSHNINLQEDNDNIELKCTPISKVAKVNKAVVMRQKALDFSDGSSDSLILNLKEARAALSSNCKRRIEGTPHRSFLEFVHLEKEVEKDDEMSFDKGIQEESNPKSPIEPFKENKQQKPRHEIESSHKSSHINLSRFNLIEIDNLSRISVASSPISDSFLYKRSTANLTPNLPFPKKRQTLLFNDCPMDESINCSEPKNISIRSTNQDIHKKCTAPESIDTEMYAMKLKAIKTDEPNKTKTSVEDIALVEDTIKQTQLKIEVSQVLKCQNKTDSPSLNTFQSTIPKTYNCDAKERKSITVQQTDTSKGGDSTVMEIYLNTIQLPRRAPTKLEDRNSCMKLPSASETSDNLVIGNEIFKNFENVFEDNPITISDVSVHYLAQRKSFIINRLGDDVSNDYLTDSNKAAVFNKQFINLERENSPLCIPEMDDIDKTRLSLVETLISENAGNDEKNELSANQSIGELVDIGKTRLSLVETLISENAEENQLSANQSIEELVVEHNCDTNRQIPVENCPLLLKENETKMITNKNHITLCRRCKHSRESFSSGSISITTESFALPSMSSSPSIGLERLERLRKLPKLKDVHEYWRRRSLEKNDSNLSNSLGFSFDSEYEKTSDPFREILNLNNCVFKRIENQLSELHFEALQTDIFFKNLNKMISEILPNWVFNYQTRARKIITFVHKRFLSFCLEFVYYDDGQLGNQISIQDVYLRSSRVSSKYWKPIDHILDFNLKINLPVDLKLLLHAGNNEDPILKLLQHMDDVCANVLEDARSLWRLVCKEEASLIRESNRVVVRKFTREFEEVVDNYPFVKKTEFQIEVNNIRTLTVKDIISPPLYAFSEELKCLPSGICFLKEFLKSPCRYLKH